MPCILRIGRSACAVFSSNAYANGSVLVSVGVKLAITGIFTSLMMPVRSRMPMPGSRFVLSVSGLITSTRTSSMRVVSMRDLSESCGDEPGFLRPRRDLRVALFAELHDLGLVLGEVRQNLGDEVVRRRDAARERIVRERLAENRRCDCEARSSSCRSARAIRTSRTPSRSGIESAIICSSDGPAPAAATTAASAAPRPAAESAPRPERPPAQRLARRAPRRDHRRAARQDG